MELYNDPQISERLPETGDALVDDKQIHASCIGPGMIEHKSYYSDSSRDIWNEAHIERWRFVRPLGRGGFGHVFLQEKISPEIQGIRPQLRAVKAIPEKEGGVLTKLHLAEILGMAKFSKKYGASFIQLFAWFALGSDICIAIEWAPYGDLEDCVTEPVPEDEARDIARQLSLAILIMHERRFLHRDLKPKNIFVFQKPPKSIGWRVKLGDFGVSKRVRETADTSWHTSIEADCSAPKVRGLLSGDDAEETSYANPVDMWSLGYVVHWLLTKSYPVSTMALPRHCFKMQPLPLTGLADVGASTQASAFVEKLLQLRPDQRMTAQQACSHPWLLVGDNKLLYSNEIVSTDQGSKMISPDLFLQHSQSMGTRLGYMSDIFREDIPRDRLNATPSGEYRPSTSGLGDVFIHPPPGHPTATDKLLIQEHGAPMQTADVGRIRDFEYRPTKIEPTFAVPKKGSSSIIIKRPVRKKIVENIKLHQLVRKLVQDDLS